MPQKGKHLLYFSSGLSWFLLSGLCILYFLSSKFTSIFCILLILKNRLLMLNILLILVLLRGAHGQATRGSNTIINQLSPSSAQFFLKSSGSNLIPSPFGGFPNSTITANLFSAPLGACAPLSANLTGKYCFVARNSSCKCLISSNLTDWNRFAFWCAA